MENKQHFHSLAVDTTEAAAVPSTILFTTTRRRKLICIVVSIIAAVLVLLSIIVPTTIILTKKVGSTIPTTLAVTTMIINTTLITATTNTTAMLTDIWPRYRWNTIGTTVFGTTGVSGSNTKLLNWPYDIAIDSTNALYIADWYNNRILKVPLGASTATVVAGDKNGTDGSRLNYLRVPTSVIVDSTFTVYVVDSGNSRGVSWANGANNGTLIAGTTGSYGSDMHQLFSPYSIARDPSNETIFISDTKNHRVQKYTSDSNNGTTVAGGNGEGYNTNQLNYPTSIAYVSSSNSLYIVNSGAHNVVRWVLGATNWTLLAGSADGTTGNTPYMLYDPNGLAVDSQDNFFVADTRNHRVQFFLADSMNATTIAGTGSPGSSPTQLNTPMSVAIDNNYNVYVADTRNQRIQKFAFR